jgi:hypothetical protein
MSARKSSALRCAISAIVEKFENRLLFDATLTPIADTYVRDGGSASTNYGEYGLLQAKQGAAGVQRQIFTKFDLSGVNESISNARLRVYGKRSNTNDASFAIAVKKLETNSWSEETTVWNNKPEVGDTITTVSVMNTTSAWTEIDVTQYILDAKAANLTNVSIAITGAASTSDYFEMSSVESTNSALRPQLVLLTQATPAAPSGLSASATTSTSVSLTWADNSGNETGFVVQRKTGAGVWATLTGAALAANSVSYSDPTAQPNTTYSYRVYATGVANSGYSNEAAVTTPGTTVQTLTPTDDTYVRGGTYASTNYENDPELQAKLTVGTNNREAYLLFNVPAGTTNVSNVKLRVYGRRNTTADGTSLAFNIKPVSSTTWDESTMTFNNKPSIGSTTLGIFNVTATTNAFYEVDLTTYVKQRVEGGQNAISLAVVGALNNSEAYFAFSSSEDPSGNGPKLVVTSSAPVAPSAPSAPINMSAAGLSPKTVRLAWTDTASNETGYQIGYRVQGSTGGYTTVSLPANAITANISNLAANTAYEFNVIATGSTNSTAASAPGSTLVNPTITSTSPKQEGTQVGLGINFGPQIPSGTFGFAWSLSSGSLSNSGASAPTFTPADNGTYTAGVTVTYPNGDAVVASTAVSVSNVAPTLTLSGSSSTAAGQSYALGVGHTDPGTDTIQSWTINWGDGSTPQTLTGATPTPSHQYAAVGTYTISASATDEDGTYVTTKAITVTQAAPIVPAVTLVAAGIGPGRISLKWANPAGDPMVAYRVYRSESASFTPSAATLVTTTDQKKTRVIDSGLSPGHIYYYRVVSVGSNAVESVPSNVASAVAQNQGAGISNGGTPFGTTHDSDGDGVPDPLDTNNDNDTLDDLQDTDDDNDGVSDAAEADDRDGDGDGTNDNDDGDDDGDGVSDAQDPDDDGDNVPDENDPSSGEYEDVPTGPGAHVVFDTLFHHAVNTHRGYHAHGYTPEYIDFSYTNEDKYVPTEPYNIEGEPNLPSTQPRRHFHTGTQNATQTFTLKNLPEHSFVELSVRMDARGHKTTEANSGNGVVAVSVNGQNVDYGVPGPGWALGFRQGFYTEDGTLTISFKGQSFAEDGAWNIYSMSAAVSTPQYSISGYGGDYVYEDEDGRMVQSATVRVWRSHTSKEEDLTIESIVDTTQGEIEGGVPTTVHFDADQDVVDIVLKRVVSDFYDSELIVGELKGPAGKRVKMVNSYFGIPFLSFLGVEEGMLHTAVCNGLATAGVAASGGDNPTTDKNGEPDEPIRGRAMKIAGNHGKNEVKALANLVVDAATGPGLDSVIACLKILDKADDVVKAAEAFKKAKDNKELLEAFTGPLTAFLSTNDNKLIHFKNDVGYYPNGVHVYVDGYLGYTIDPGPRKVTGAISGTIPNIVKADSGYVLVATAVEKVESVKFTGSYVLDANSIPLATIEK